MNKIQLIENTPNFNDLVKAGIVSTSLPAKMEIYYHYCKTKKADETSIEKKCSERYVYSIKRDFESELNY